MDKSLIGTTMKTSQTKICTNENCKQEKPLSEFHNRKDAKDGKRNECKECIWKKQQIYRDTHDVEIKAYKKIFAINNKEKIIKYRKKHYAENKTIIDEKSKEYREKNKDSINKRKRDLYHGNIELTKENRSEYYSNNRENVLAKCNKYREANRDKINKQKNEHYYANKEEILKKQKEYAQNNPHIMKKWREDNKEQIVEYRKRYSKQEYAIIAKRISEHKRRISKISEDCITSIEIQELLKNSNYICYWCGKNCKKDFHIDHYFPLSKSGEHTKDNIVIACPQCNLTKGAKDPLEFAQTKGKLL